MAKVIEKEKLMKKVKAFSEVFLLDAFNEIEENVECFSIFDFQDKSLFFSISSFVCEARLKLKSEMECKTIVKEFVGGKFDITFEEEPILRHVFGDVVNELVETNKKGADEDRALRVEWAGSTCKKMCDVACDCIFGSEREEIIEQRTKAKQEVKTFVQKVISNNTRSQTITH